MKDVRSKMARGAAWTVSFKLLDRGLALISTLVLARILVPADFGLIAMAASLVSMLDLFNAFGLDVALIQRQRADAAHFNTAWTLNIASGSIIAALMLALAWPLAHFYSEPRLTGVVCCLALSSLVQGFENIGVVTFRKEMNFGRDFMFLLGKRIAMLCVTISLALLLRNYWAMVAGMVFGRIAGVSLSYVLHPFRPRLSLEKLHDFFGFSKWVFAQNFLYFLKERSSDFIVGRLAGPAGLGVFNVSTEIASMPGTELIAPLNRAIVPAYALLAENPEALRREYVSVTGIVSIIAVPAVTGIAAVAPLIVAAVLGSKWRDASPILAMLAFYGIFSALTSNAYSAFLAVGRPRTFVRITGTYVCIHLPMLIFLTHRYGVLGAASAHLAASAIILPISFHLICQTLGLRLMVIVAAVWRPVVAAALMYAVVVAARPVIDPAVISSFEAVRLLAVFAALGAVTYAAGLASLWWLAGRPEGGEAMILRVAGRKWRALRSRAGPK
jgi:O-antigen/teichoic acid export membrane protein